MARITIDMSGKGGLVEKYHGDINDVIASPQLRYLSGEGQVANGIYNPFKKYGYMSPSTDAFVSLSGTVSAPVTAIQYDSQTDVLYLAEEGENILQLDGLDDTSLSNYLSIESGHTIKDMVLAEINNSKALFYVIDTGARLKGPNTSTQEREFIYEDGMYLGYKAIDSSKGTIGKDTAITGDFGVNNSRIDDGTTYHRILAQSFTTQESISGILSNAVSGVRLKLRRSSGTGVGITMKVSIQASEPRNVSPYSFKGNWATSTSYVAGDVVESDNNNDINYMCHTAHTSAAADEPGVGANWADYWDKFGSPDGTAIVSGTFALDTVPDGAGMTGVGETTDIAYRALHETEITFDSIAELSAGTVYWIVLEEVGTNMTSGDILDWIGTFGDSFGTYVPDVGIAQTAFLQDDTYPAIGKYFDSADPWRAISTLETSTDGLSYKLVLNRDDNWSATSANGAFGVETGLDTSLYLADNGLIYWFTGDKVHTADGSLTGGNMGRVVENVLAFPSYTRVTAVAETRSRMYMGVQTSEKTSIGDSKAYTARKVGVYVWDRRSQVLGGTDFYLCPGAKEIKALFTSSSGDVRVITVGNNNFTEIRGISGNQFAVLQTLDIGAYPANYKSVSQVDQMSVWLGVNGIFYGFGSPAPRQPEALFKLGDMSGEAAASLITGPIFVGNEFITNPQTAVIFAWSDGTPTYKIQKWYPYGEGTLNSVAQTSLNGNIYWPVQYLPPMSTVQTLTIYCAPTTTADGTTIGTLKLYKNQQTTPFITKTITNTDASRGYIAIDINSHNINALQLELEHSAATITGNEEFYPSLAIIDYKSTNTHTPSAE